jgi:hypothetical protein
MMVQWKFFKTAQQPAACVLLAGLLRNDALIDISAVAVLRDPPAEK